MRRYNIEPYLSWYHESRLIITKFFSATENGELREYVHTLRVQSWAQMEKLILRWISITNLAQAMGQGW